MVDAQQAVSHALDEARMVVRNQAAVRAKAEILYGWLLQYVAHQDDEFYRSLRLRYQTNPSAVKIIDFFEEDLKNLKVKLYHFEERHLTGRLDGAGKWTADFIELSQAITGRLQMEHAQLFPLLAAAANPVAS
jgi:UDP-N-acetylmuramyl pentapeptide synthase